ncbi:MAG TPA: hypothetical protein VJS92_06235, partial [Candidatus Polarisedimenticolaceae bacterium]|nr:hypothetical protein [Candidatus Polarisedimenticolaceae bacterium]
MSPAAQPARAVLWVTALTLAAIVAVNAAGLWGIALGRRSAREAAERTLQLETGSRAHELEARLAGAWADLDFLSGSPAFRSFDTHPATGPEWEARFRHSAFGGALLLLLRS